jgi:hypothetical protein
MDSRIEFTITTTDPATAETLAYNTALELFGCNRDRESNQFVGDPSHVSVEHLGVGERVNSMLGDLDGGHWRFEVRAEYRAPF